MDVTSALRIKMIQRTRAVCSIGAGGADNKVEWSPELNRARGVVKEWSEQRFWEAMIVLASNNKQIAVYEAGKIKVTKLTFDELFYTKIYPTR